MYLASHDRPINELIDPVKKDCRQIYENEFAGMTASETRYDELIAARESLITTLSQQLTQPEKDFLLSLKQGEPQWSLLGLEGIEKLPALQWKLQNIRKLSKGKHVDALARLKAKLGRSGQ